MRPSAGCGSTDGLLSSTVTSIAVVHPAAADAKDDVRGKGHGELPHLQNAGALKSFPSMPVT